VDLKAEALEAVDKATSVGTSTPAITPPASTSSDASGDDSDKEDLVILSALTTSTLPEKPTTPQEESQTNPASIPADSEVEGSVGGEEDSAIPQPPNKGVEMWVNVKAKETTEEQEVSSNATTEGN